MDKCPKCGCIKISEPRYENLEGREWLRYYCQRCGYSETRPTLDRECIARLKQGEGK